MMKMKKIFMAFFLCFVFVGCGNQQIDSDYKAMETKFDEGNWFIDCGEDACNIKKFYTDDTYDYIRYDKNSEKLTYVYKPVSEHDSIDVLTKEYIESSLCDGHLENGKQILSTRIDFIMDDLDVTPEDIISFINTRMDLVAKAGGVLEYDNITANNGEDNEPLKIDGLDELLNINETEKHFNIATNLTEDKFVVRNGDEYYYDVFNIPVTDETFELYGKADSYELYFSVARYLEGFDMGINNGSKYSEQIVGVETTSRDEFKPYYDNLSTFIVTKESDIDSLTAIMNKFESCTSVSGIFDYENEIFNFTIANCNETAKEMGISEQMLGYIFGFLDVYGSNLTFDGSGCTFEVDVNRTIK